MTPLKLAQGLTDEILALIHKYDDSMPLVSVLGVLEVVKLNLVAEAQQREDEE